MVPNRKPTSDEIKSITYYYRKIKSGNDRLEQIEFYHISLTLFTDNSYVHILPDDYNYNIITWHNLTYPTFREFKLYSLVIDKSSLNVRSLNRVE